jgi:hypothetical protein
MVESGQQETKLEQGKKLMRNYKLQGSESLGTQTTTAPPAFTKLWLCHRFPFLLFFRLIRQDVSIYANKHK